MQTLSFTNWEHGDRYACEDYPLNAELPARPDTYSPRHLSWGKNPTRGRAIQAARLRKRHHVNRARFLEFLPQIEARLTPDDWRALAQALNLPDFTPARGGLVLYRNAEGRFAWVHPTLEPEIAARAIAAGATPQP